MMQPLRSAPVDGPARPAWCRRRPGRARVALAAALALAACTSATSTEPSAPPSPTVIVPATPEAPATVDDGTTADDAPTGDGSERAATDEPRAIPSPPPLHPSVDGYPAGRVVVEPGDGADAIPVVVRIADDAERRSHGLMEVEDVPDDVGMWFSYDEDHDGAFWMKGTRTDLDIAWVDETGRIVAIATMAVCEADPCDTYDPGATYRTALEVRAGWFADNGVEVGGRIMADVT